MRGGLDAVGTVHQVVHPRRQAQLAERGQVDEHGPVVVVTAELRAQGRGQRRPGARVLAGLRERLVGHQLGLHDKRGRAAQRLDLVEDGGDCPLGEGDEAGG